MRKCARVAALVLLWEILFHSSAHAEETWAQQHSIFIGGIAFTGLLADFGFTTIAVREQPIHMRWLAATEVAVTAPQVPAMLYIGIGNPFDLGTPERVLMVAASVWPAWLAAHGIWSLAVGGNEPLPPRHRAATWGPTVVSDGVRLAPAFGISGAF